MKKISKINNYIYLGKSPDIEDEEFIGEKFDIVINCAEEINYDGEFTWKLHCFPIKDEDDISFVDNMDKIVALMRKSVSLRKKIYIHCTNGKSRSPAILIYFYMMSKNLTFKQAHKAVKKSAPKINIHQCYVDVLLLINE